MGGFSTILEGLSSFSSHLGTLSSSPTLGSTRFSAPIHRAALFGIAVQKKTGAWECSSVNQIPKEKLNGNRYGEVVQL
jgi:hypothetical protein